jgi:predicted ATPase
MPAPYLRRIWLDPSRVADRKAYPFCLPFLRNDFELRFEHPITIIVRENGTGKSTLLEGIAVLAGYDEAGGGKGYRPVDHSDAVEVMGGELSEACVPAGCPKSQMDGSSGPRVSLVSRAVWIKRPENR